MTVRTSAESSASSRSDYDRRVNSSTPMVGEEEIKAKFRFGLDDLLKQLEL